MAFRLFAWIDIIINVVFLLWWLTKYIIKDYFFKIVNKIKGKDKDKEKDIRGLIFLLTNNFPRINRNPKR